MGISTIVTTLFGERQWLLKLARRLRYGPRVEVTLDWGRILLIGRAGPSSNWRTLKVAITAAKHEEFFVARGAVEAREIGDKIWIEVCEILRLVSLPMEVPANRKKDFRLSGETLSKELPKSWKKSELFELRVRLYDLHKKRIQSSPLQTSKSELEREEYR